MPSCPVRGWHCRSAPYVSLGRHKPAPGPSLRPTNFLPNMGDEGWPLGIQWRPPKRMHAAGSLKPGCLLRILPAYRHERGEQPFSNAHAAARHNNTDRRESKGDSWSGELWTVAGWGRQRDLWIHADNNNGMADMKTRAPQPGVKAPSIPGSQISFHPPQPPAALEMGSSRHLRWSRSCLQSVSTELQGIGWMSPKPCLEAPFISM